VARCLSRVTMPVTEDKEFRADPRDGQQGQRAFCDRVERGARAAAGLSAAAN
jgi:hypothetical protein